MMRAGGVVVVLVGLASAAGCGKVQQSVADAAPAPALLDAAAMVLDVMPDTPTPETRFDVGYVNDFTVPADTDSVFGFALVVNTGAAPLDLGTATVVTVTDDNDAVDWTFTKKAGSTTMLVPNHAAGLLTLAAHDKVVTGGVVSEPIDDQLLDFSMGFASPPTAGTSLHGQVVLEIQHSVAILPFTVSVVASGDLLLNVARRVSSQQ
jgi:hypothetical protein